MDETDGGRFRIDNVDGTAIGDVNAERDAALICDESVATGEFLVRCWRLIDNRDFVAVDLLGGKQRPFGQTDLAANFAMRSVETAQDLCLVVRDINARDAAGESVNAIRQRTERVETFEWERQGQTD